MSQYEVSPEFVEMALAQMPPETREQVRPDIATARVVVESHGSGFGEVAFARDDAGALEMLRSEMRDAARESGIPNARATVEHELATATEKLAQFLADPEHAGDPHTITIGDFSWKVMTIQQWVRLPQTGTD